MKIITYKFHDSKKRRLAIQCEKLDDTHAEISIIRCSTQDSFSKKFAREAFEKGVDGVHIEKRVIAWSSNTLTNWKRQFYTYCSDNFYKRTYVRKYVKIELLEKGGYKVPLKPKLNLNKLNLY